MPRFYFDTCDGDIDHRDEHGQIVTDAAAARRLAIGTLPDMARDKLPDGDRRSFTVRVRDAAGTVLYSAELALAGEWHVPPPGDAPKKSLGADLV